MNSGESLWLENNNRMASGRLAKRQESKLSRFIRQFDSSNISPSHGGITTKTISAPIAFNHVAHIDATNYNHNRIDDMSLSNDVGQIQHIQLQDTGTGAEKPNVSHTPLVSHGQQGDLPLIRATSFGRTNPAPPPTRSVSRHMPTIPPSRSDHSINTMLQNHSRHNSVSTLPTTSIYTSTSSTSFRMSLASESSASIPPSPAIEDTKSRPLLLLNKSTDTFSPDEHTPTAVLFTSPPIYEEAESPPAPARRAPLPPISIDPIERFKSLVRKHNCVDKFSKSPSNANSNSNLALDLDLDLDIYQDSDTEGDEDTVKLEKLELSSPVEAVVAEFTFRKQLKEFTRTKNCRNSIMMMMKVEQDPSEREYLAKLLDKTQFEIRKFIETLNTRNSLAVSNMLEEDPKAFLDSVSFGDTDSIIDTDFQFNETESDFFKDLQIGCSCNTSLDSLRQLDL